MVWKTNIHKTLRNQLNNKHLTSIISGRHFLVLKQRSHHGICLVKRTNIISCPFNSERDGENAEVSVCDIRVRLITCS